MRGKNGPWHYTAPCGKRTKWPSERHDPDYKNSTDAFIFIYIVMIIRKRKNAHERSNFNSSPSFELPVRKEFEFHSFKNWRIMNFRKVKSTKTVRKSLSQQPCMLVLWRCFINGVCIVDGYIKCCDSPSKSPAMIRKSFHIHRFNWYFEHILSKFK